MTASFVQLQYCYEYVMSQIPFSLILYSHLPPAILALCFGAYVLFKVRSLASVNLFMVCTLFALWSLFDLIAWFPFLGSGVMMFAWSLLDLVSVAMFCFGYYFLYAFHTGEDLPRWQKLVGALLLAPTAVMTLVGMNLTAFDANTCEALEHPFAPAILHSVEGFILLAIAVLGVRLYVRERDKRKKRQVLLTTLGLFLFLGFFLSANLAVSLLVNYGLSAYAYNYAIYGLFGMPVFLGYLSYVIVRYRAFNLKIFSTQALILALVALVGSQFAFTTYTASQLLVAVTLILTGIIGIELIRGVRREIEQRERIERLARELEQANKQQTALIRFITHQLKGYMAKSRNIFSLIQDGDFGPVPDAMRPIVDEGFRSSTKGAQTIQEILNAANMKSGAVTYEKRPFDLAELVRSVADALRPNAAAKGLTLAVAGTDGPRTVVGDRMQFENAIRNLIDNSIKYTPAGSVDVTIDRRVDCIRLVITDTGVGITPEDMAVLFTEGGHGKDAHKVNVDSTGFGLYIVKNIVEAHGGIVWAESEGAGKGARFIMELPAASVPAP